MLLEIGPLGLTTNQIFYLEILRRLRNSVCQKAKCVANWFFHHKNAPAHVAISVHQFCAKNSDLTWPTKFIHLT